MTDKEYLKKVGMEIRVARIRKGVTREELSKMTGLGTDSFSRMENGRNDSKILSYKRICDALNIDIKELLKFGE